MKNLKTLLTVLTVSICAVQSAWADRSAPQLPAAVTLVSGQSYYLYNVQEGKFACRSTTNTAFPGIGTYGDKVTITSTSNEGEYNIQWANDNHYWYGYDTYVGSTYDNYNMADLNCFFIAESSTGYTIQRSSRNFYYKADEYIGYNGNNGDRLNPALANGSIHWQFMTVDEAEHYFAKHKLYTYLTIADTYNFYVTQYDDVYNDPNSTTELLNQAYETLYDAVTVSSNYVSPSWTEYPILFQNTTENKWKNDSGRLEWYYYSDGTVKTSRLTGTINVDDDATVVYTYWNTNPYSSLRVFLDGVLVQTVSNNQSQNNGRRYYVEVTAGKHDIVWEAVCNDSRTEGYMDSNYLSEIGVVNTPTIYPATTTVEGQLGTEVLKLTDPVSNVKKIVIKGVIGDDDWTTIGLMANAFSIDMSGATATNIPAYQFTKDKYPFLHSVKLPQGITSIGESAFNRSDIEDEITFPNTLETIGNSAFSGSKVKTAYMHNNITSVEYRAFEDCYFLEYASWSSAASSIPDNCFDACYNLRTFDIPEGVTDIRDRAFRSALLFNPRFPTTIKRIYYDAFYNTGTDQLIIPEDVTVDYHAFGHCNNLVSAEWPTSFDYAGGGTYGTNEVVVECPNLETVYLKSPTKVLYDGPSFFSGNTLSDITLHVPDYLVTTYKLDPYWSQCNVVGFDSEDISDWTVKQPLKLASERISGTPNLHVMGSGQIEVSGDVVQNIGNLSINFNNRRVHDDNWKYYDVEWGFMLSNTNTVNITGELSENICTGGGKWYFMTLPFDTKVSDISNTNNASYAIRYYDGANRASFGTGSNWKNYGPEDIIPAGTGFILQTNKVTYSKFVAQDNATKQYILSNNEFVKALEAHDTEVTANKGWNLVGNPWQTYYNIHKLNFTAPITVWNYDYNRYDAYSIIDDDYAIKPLEAFFVQCPDEVGSISFPIDGRQLTDVIESVSGARRFGESTRKLVDIELTNGEMTDKTRFVLNPQAKMDYETNCDASKFFSMESGVAQIYTIQNGVQMAINERPANDGVVTIGMKIPADGTYTIKSERTALKEAVIVDKLNGTETTLSAEGYTFSAHAGTIDNRFELHLSASETTGIKELKDSSIEELKSFYNLNGQRMSAPQKGINVVNGKKVIIK